jgi:hypothetical protein
MFTLMNQFLPHQITSRCIAYIPAIMGDVRLSFVAGAQDSSSQSATRKDKGTDIPLT